jgi:hypothetical protein
MAFIESVCEVISFASLENNQADQRKFLADWLDFEWSVYRWDGMYIEISRIIS